MVIDCHNHIGEPWGTRDRQTPEELLEKYQPDGDRVASLRLQERIRSLAQPVKMTGSSRRNSAA